MQIKVLSKGTPTQAKAPATGISGEIKPTKQLGLGEGLSRSIAAGALGLPGNIEHLLGMPLEAMTGQEVPHFFPTSQDLLNKSKAATGADWQPANWVEDVLDSTARNLIPTLLLPAEGIKALGSNLLRDVASSTAQVGAKELGLGLPGQLVAGVMSGVGLRNAANYMKRIEDPSKLLNMAKVREKELYALESKLGSQIPLTVKERYQFKKGIDDVSNAMKKQSFANATQKNDFLKRAELWQEEAKTPGMTASDLVQRQQEINRDIDGFYGQADRTGKHFMDKFRALSKEQIEEVGKRNPEWFKTWRGANDITQAVNFSSYFDDFVKGVPKVGKYLSPILKTIFGVATPAVGAAIGGPLGLGGVAVGGIAKGNKAMQFLRHGPETQKLLYQASKNIVNRNYDLAFKDIVKLDKKATNWEKQQEKKQESTKAPSSSNIKILSKGFQNQP